jgi:hypothetical protein
VLADSYTNLGVLYRAMHKPEIGAKFADLAIAQLERLHSLMQETGQLDTDLVDKLYLGYMYRVSFESRQ